MAQVVSSERYCIEDSNNLTRTSLSTFLQSEEVNAPLIIDKNQAKRQYRLQNALPTNNSTFIEPSNNTLERSSSQPIKTVYHRPMDMSNESMKLFSYGKARLDPQRSIPTDLTIHRSHPAAYPSLRTEYETPRHNDRRVLDHFVRSKIGPVKRSYDPNRRQPVEYDTDEKARHFMYTSETQSAYDEVPWDSKLPPKLPTPSTTLEKHGANPFYVSRSLTHFDDRTFDILNWDKDQSRKFYFNRKPFQNVAPLTRAQQIPGYSGVIGGDNFLDIDNPTVDFKPYTVVRTEQPKPAIEPIKANIPKYTGKSHWTSIEPVSHLDSQNRAFTTTAAFHKPLPFDFSEVRHGGVHGDLGKLVTTVQPQNPFVYKESPRRSS